MLTPPPGAGGNNLKEDMMGKAKIIYGPNGKARLAKATALAGGGEEPGYLIVFMNEILLPEDEERLVLAGYPESVIIVEGFDPYDDRHAKLAREMVSERLPIRRKYQEITFITLSPEKLIFVSAKPIYTSILNGQAPFGRFELIEAPA